nr:MAG: ORF1 [Giant panda anellovirus]USZ80593.1 ORF1 [Tick-associated anellovirus 3]
MARYYYRRRWPRRRRNFRWRYRQFRPWISRRRYFRRQHRVRRRRRRFYKKRQYISALMQWHPSHRKICIIKGWSYAFYGVDGNTCTNFQSWNEPTHGKLGFYRQYGGGASLYHMTLDWLYDEHKKHHNVWSASNEGFDIARYFGTTIYLWPHPDITYIFWWETNYGNLRPSDYQLIQPAYCLLQKNHVIVKSIKYGGRKLKKIRIHPPSVHQTQWYFMKNWCGAGLLRFGFSLFNINQTFIHENETRPWVIIGSNTSMTDITTLGQDIPMPTTENKNWYKYHWDRAENNKIAWGKKNVNKLLQLGMTDITVPYWIYYYGQGWTNLNSNDDWYYFIWWYNDPVKTDKDAWEPQDLTNQKKCWVLLRTNETNTPLTVVNMVQKAPFCYSKEDIHTQTQSSNFFNLPFFYKSKWQWGGVSPAPETTVNPCDQPPTSDNIRAVRIGNPATTGQAVLHPWDLDKAGFITKHKLRQLIRHPSPPDTGIQEEELPQKSPHLDSEPSTEESGDSDSESSQSSDQEEPSLYSLTKRISRERKHRHKLIRRIRKLVNS